MHVGFNNFQFDYNKGVPEQALLTKTRKTYVIVFTTAGYFYIFQA